DLVRVVVSLANPPGPDYVSDVKDLLGPFGRVTPLARANRLLVQDIADNVRAVLSVIGELEEEEKRVVERIPLGSLDADKVARMLGSAGLGEPTPLIEADAMSNAVIVKATANQVKQVKDLINVMRGTSGAKGDNMRTFTLEKGSAVTLALEIKRVLLDLRKSDVQP